MKTSIKRKKAFCNKCSEEVRRQHGVEPADILDENRECILCGEPKVCPVCAHEQDGRYGDSPLLVCMDCIAEADRYLLGIDDVNQEINSSLRSREAQGWTPSSLVVDAISQDRGLVNVAVNPGEQIVLEPEPMVFAVAILFRKGEKAQLDFVALCPVALRRQFHEAIEREGSINGIALKLDPPQ